MPHSDFYQDIVKFNEIYKLENHDEPQLLPPSRISQFRDILAEEVEEAKDIEEKYQSFLSRAASGQLTDENEKREILTDMSDWLGDIIVYCASEARRWGLPLSDILNIIMQSNFSKLDEQGHPIYDHRGKVMKGPHYWRPEPKINELLGNKTSVES